MLMTRSCYQRGTWFKRLGYITLLLCVVLIMVMVSQKMLTLQLSQSSDLRMMLANDAAQRRKHNCHLTSSNMSKPIEHIYYLKTHKTGSTTMYSILAEYCRTHELLPLLPRGVHINQALPFRKSQVLLDPDVKKYDMVFNHHVFSPEILKYLHADTFVFTTLREPFEQMVSSFQYFKKEGQMKYLNRIKGSDPVKEYLSNQKIYEAKGYHSYTNNRQSMDLGYDIRKSFDDINYINEFILLTDQRYDLVLISDYFHESLILLKRALQWNTKHILYYRKNARSKQSKFETRNVSMSIPRQQHAKFSRADILLYGYFLEKFKDRMFQEKNLQGEVAEFEDVLTKVHTFCDSPNSKLKRLDIPAGRWTDPITIFRNKCKWLKMGEVDFTTHLKSRQKVLFQS